MERSERLVFCEKCVLREFSGNLGLVCSLTNDHAAFDETCPYFKEDVNANHKDQTSTNNPTASSSSSYVAWLIALSILWYATGFYAFGRDFTYPGTAIFLVFVVIVKVSRDGRKNKKKRRIKN